MTTGEKSGGDLPKSGPEETLATLADRYWEFQTREFPLRAAFSGDDAHPDLLDRESLSDYERRDPELARVLGAARAIPPEGLSAASRTTREMLIREVELERQSYSLGVHLEASLLFPFGPHSALILMPQSLAIQGAQGCKDYVARVDKVARVMQEVVTRMRAGVHEGRRLPKVLRGRLIEAAGKFAQSDREAIDHWMRPLQAAKNSVSQATYSASQEAVAGCVTASIAPAFEEYLRFIRDELPMRESVSIADGNAGEELYAHLMRVHLGPGYDARELHGWGHDEVARIEAEMRRQQQALGETGDLREFLLRRAQRPEARLASAEELLTRVSVISKRIDGLVPRFFEHIPRQTYGIDLMPAAGAGGMPPAYADPSPPGALRAGIHWVNPQPERCTVDMLIPLALHEAWPGHLMHIALLTELEELPAFRRYGALRATAYLEGWALYCERLGIEMGLYRTPDDHLGRLAMEVWRAARLVVDTGLHALRWPRAQAVEYMRAHTSLPDETIEAEIDRYIGMPAQALAYKVGERKFLELRAQAEGRFGERFDVRSFHQRLFACGAVSLDQLDSYVREWGGPMESDSAGTGPALV